MDEPNGMRLALIDDGGGTLGPLTDLRPAFDVRTGALTARERLEIASKSRVSALWAPPEVARAIEPESGVLVNQLPACAEALVVSGRCAAGFEGLLELAPGEVVVEPGTGDFVAARLDRERAVRLLESGGREGLEGAREADGPCLIRRPWDVVRRLGARLESDLSLLVRRSEGWMRQVPEGVAVVGERRVAIDPSADVAPTAVLDVSDGPVLIAERARVRPGATIIGPAYVGAGSTVLDKALVKANTAIGPVCKVAGEVGATVFQGYANKAHDGHLGDSWVGAWANLGAGTTNSNLMNTYGEVTARATPSSARERTGMTFLGAIIGDHAKTAICTRLMTGSVIGTGAMIATTAAPPTSTPAFAWLTDGGAKTYRIEKFLEVARTVMGRRGVEMSEGMEALIRARHAEASG